MTDLATLPGASGTGSKLNRKARSRQTLTRQKTDEEIKKLYGIRKVDRETKHLDIMIEMAQTTYQASKQQNNSSRTRNKNDDVALEHAKQGQGKTTQKLIKEQAMVSPEMRMLITKAQAVEDRF